MHQCIYTILYVHKIHGGPRNRCQFQIQLNILPRVRDEFFPLWPMLYKKIHYAQHVMKIQEDPLCSACGEQEETSLHFLGEYCANMQIRYSIF